MKTFLTSRTIWFGIAQLAYGIVGLIFGWVDSGTALTLITTGIGTIGFRTITTEQIK